MRATAVSAQPTAASSRSQQLQSRRSGANNMAELARAVAVRSPIGPLPPRARHCCRSRKKCAGNDDGRSRGIPPRCGAQPAHRLTVRRHAAQLRRCRVGCSKPTLEAGEHWSQPGIMRCSEPRFRSPAAVWVLAVAGSSIPSASAARARSAGASACGASRIALRLLRRLVSQFVAARIALAAAGAVPVPQRRSGRRRPTCLPVHDDRSRSASAYPLCLRRDPSPLLIPPFALTSGWRAAFVNRRTRPYGGAG
jgi:hypothetical protein